MRIVLVTATPQTVAAGSGTYAASSALAHALEGLGHEVVVVAPAWRTAGALYALRRLAFNRRVARRWPAGDVIVGVDLDGYRAAGGARPFVSYIHGQLADEARFERGFTRASMLLQAHYEGRAARRADRVLTVSRYARRRIHELYGVPLDGIGVVPPVFDADAWQARLARAERVGEASCRVLAVARLYPRKNLEALVRATRLLHDRGMSVETRIVGDGPARRALAAAVRHAGVTDSVRLAGFVPEERLAVEFRAATVFCLPSRQEGFGLVFLQAMAAGLPVVALRTTSTPEIVSHNETGWLVPPDDDTALADALEQVLGNPSLRDRLGSAGRERARHFGPDAVGRRFLAEIAPLVRNAGPARGVSGR